MPDDTTNPLRPIAERIIRAEDSGLPVNHDDAILLARLVLRGECLDASAPSPAPLCTKCGKSPAQLPGEICVDCLVPRSDEINWP